MLANELAECVQPYRYLTKGKDRLMVSKVMAKPKGFSNLLSSRTSERFVAELVSIIDREIDDSGGFKWQYLRQEILSKYLDPKVVAPDARARAGVQKWLHAEQQNERTNLRLWHANASDPDFGWTTWYHFVDAVRSLIARLLGPCPGLLLRGEFSNKASSRIGRRETASLEKLKGECHVSSDALKWFQAFWCLTPYKPEGHKVQDSSIMFTVVKKSDIDRVACKEPEGNMLLQRQIGWYISERLRRKAGINTHDQSRNRHLAHIGSKDRVLATIDLSSASDTISHELVRTFLPTQWYSLLDDYRVKTTLIPYRIQPDAIRTDDRSDYLHGLNMFSSMGNGFTFELETLIFYAVVKTVQKLSGPRFRGSIVSVYGDDIICHGGLVPRIQRIFSFLGFTLNEKKTHWRRNDPFRESCGGHYYDGFDVTPFYIREEVREKSHLIQLLNQLLEWDGRVWGFFETPSLAAFHLKWSQHVPLRFHGGVSTDETGALVTGDSPRDTIEPIRRPVDTSRFELQKLLKWFIDSERLGKVQNVVSVRKHKDTVVVLPNELTRVVGHSPRPHPEKGTGRRTSWTPYMVYPLGR